jgi:hypothetical protein
MCSNYRAKRIALIVSILTIGAMHATSTDRQYADGAPGARAVQESWSR